MDHTLQDLADTIAHNATASTDVSYTAKLLRKGVGHIAKKLGEEGVECALAAVAESDENLISESADLLYHLLVLLHAKDISLDEVLAELARRKGVSGINEKKSRKE
jgi:phosphoribosyl-ATP pyrophosphohydrolase